MPDLIDRHQQRSSDRSKLDSRSSVAWRRAASRVRALVILSCLVGLLAAPAAWAQGQLMLSITYQGPSAASWAIDPGGAYIVTPGPGWQSLFWGPYHLGVMASMYNFAEVDAFSWGRDTAMNRDGMWWAEPYRLFFSTDEFATGMPATGTPSVFSEGAGGFLEASADIQRVQLFPSQVAPPFPAFYSHVSALDGNGVLPFGGLGLGLVENNPPAPGADAGDTIDALDFWSQSADMRLYFSLDADFTDPLEAGFGNIGTAAINGVNAGDVLVSDGSGTHSVWAPALLLGLDLNDDLDALILWENGNGVFNPSAEPFDWSSGDTDMLLFSVRRGSPVIGQPDSQFGQPIREGDILTTPCNIVPCFGGIYPAKFIRRQSLGLGPSDDLDAMTVR